MSAQEIPHHFEVIAYYCSNFGTNGHFAFFSRLCGGGGLGATYTVHLRLIVGKLVVDFLLVLIQLFFARCHS